MAFLDLKTYCGFSGREVSPPPEVVELLQMSEEEYHDMEAYYEGFHAGGSGEPKTFLQTASWLQTLPGWPRVL